jgi:hypothetical protein
MNAEIKSATLLDAIRKAALRSTSGGGGELKELDPGDEFDDEPGDELLEQHMSPNHSTTTHPQLTTSGGLSSPLSSSETKLSKSLSRPKSYDGRPPQRSPLNHSPSPSSSATSSSRALNFETESNPLRKVPSASNSSVGTESSDGTITIQKYLPTLFFGLFGDGQCSSPLFVSSEREFIQLMSSIQTNLLNKEDWQARQNGLFKFQSVLKGIFESSFLESEQYEESGYLSGDTVMELLIGFIRSSLVETMATQISDLRSTISKEACRTVAMMARVMRGNLAQFVEFWIPSLLKLLMVKIQVIMSAADRCVRAIVVCCGPNGIPKLLQILLETLSSKSPASRRYCFEYITLAAISWESENAFER